MKRPCLCTRNMHCNMCVHGTPQPHPKPQVMLYMRKRSNQPVDIELVLYALLAAVDVFSAALVAVLALVSLYWLALAKVQVGRGIRSL